jgi:hypothetical protein
MQYRLVVEVDKKEHALDVYFKREEIGAQWIRHHYVLIGLLVWLLRQTRNYDVKLKRII